MDDQYLKECKQWVLDARIKNGLDTHGGKLWWPPTGTWEPIDPANIHPHYALYSDYYNPLLLLL